MAGEQLDRWSEERADELASEAAHAALESLI